MTARPTVSACVIARNEAEELADCLSALTWADEIVVVDDESTDQTVEIAERFTKRVLVRPKRDDFAAQRNFALDAAVGDWVLFIDADERVSGALRDEILAAVRTPGVDGYFVRRQDINFGHVFRHGQSMRTPLLRLARRHAGRFHGRVHETWRVRGPTRVLHAPLLHHSHADISAFLRKVDYQSSLAATRLAEEGRGRHAWELVVHPVGNFLRNYVVHQGFRDGMPGLIYALLMALHPFLARAKRWERQRRP
jgi:glycosyltransferase involved in cell wall biosynthesis